MAQSLEMFDPYDTDNETFNMLYRLNPSLYNQNTISRLENQKAQRRPRSLVHFELVKKKEEIKLVDQKKTEEIDLALID